MGANLDGVCVCVRSRFMDEGPSGAGNSVSNMAPVVDEIFARMQAGAWGL